MLLSPARAIDLNMQPRANEIIGAASGTGLEIAKILITKGATLPIPDIQDAALQSAASQLKELGGPDAKRTVAEFAGLHCAVNFAGVVDDQMGARNMSQQDDDDDYNFVMNVTFWGFGTACELS
ncbi:hypothetical protein NW759_011417 [Fusarium solani]|nr:hypothetical protein NW759_011417 [Fusarium solani]